MTDHMLSRISELVANEVGLHFPEARWGDLERGIRAAARDLGFPSMDLYVQELLSASTTKQKFETLASYLTVGETYFFREKNTFDVLENRILPEIVRTCRSRGKQIRIWSVGCCTGEEPYSIAILLDRLIPDIDQWHATILATDINPRFLQKAELGVYTHWSFRDTPEWIRERYFSHDKGRLHEIKPRLRKSVAFAYLNLAEDIYPSIITNTNAMDLILCRNVLMYFSPEQAMKCIRNFHRSVVEGGYLIVGSSETSLTQSSEFLPVNVAGITFYQKHSRKVGREMSPTVQSIPAWSPPEPFDRCSEPGPSMETDEFVPFSSPGDQAELIYEEKGGSEAILPPKEETEAPEKNAFRLYEQGQYLQAIEKLESLHSEGRSSAETMALLARAHANQGNLHEAKNWSEKAIAADKLNPRLYYLRGIIFQELNEKEEAAAALKQALYLAPDFILAHFTLGHLALRRGDKKTASKSLSNVISLLRKFSQEEILPESEGITVGRMSEMVAAYVSEMEGAD